MVNKENVEVLVESIINGKFDWFSTQDCIGGHAKKLLGKEYKGGVSSIEKLLNVNVDTAYALFSIQNVKASDRYDKELAIEKLRSLI